MRGRAARGAGMANQTGKRYYCERCGSEFIVTTGGPAVIYWFGGGNR